MNVLHVKTHTNAPLYLVVLVHTSTIADSGKSSSSKSGRGFSSLFKSSSKLSSAQSVNELSSTSPQATSSPNLASPSESGANHSGNNHDSAGRASKDSHRYAPNDKVKVDSPRLQPSPITKAHSVAHFGADNSNSTFGKSKVSSNSSNHESEESAAHKSDLSGGRRKHPSESSQGKDPKTAMMQLSSSQEDTALHCKCHFLFLLLPLPAAEGRILLEDVASSCAKWFETTTRVTIEPKLPRRDLFLVHELIFSFEIETPSQKVQ